MKKKSLSSRPSTAVSRNRKGSGVLKNALEELGHLKLKAPEGQTSMLQVIKQLMLSTGNPRKLALLLAVAGHLMEGMSRSQLESLGTPDEKPWEQEG